MTDEQVITQALALFKAWQTTNDPSARKRFWTFTRRVDKRDPELGWKVMLAVHNFTSRKRKG
jgi:hypothetical protein